MLYYKLSMNKMLTVRLPEELVAQIEAESQRRKLSKSDVVRERLTAARSRARKSSSLDTIVDLIGTVGGLPRDLSANVDKHLKRAAYGIGRRR